MKDGWREGVWDWKWHRRLRGGREEDHLNGLIEALLQVRISNENDYFVWRLDVEGMFTVKSTRMCIDRILLKGGNISFSWNKNFPRRVCTFLWCALQDRLPSF